MKKQFLSIVFLFGLIFSTFGQNAPIWEKYESLAKSGKVRDAQTLLNQIRSSAEQKKDTETLFRVEVEHIKLKDNYSEEGYIAAILYIDTLLTYWKEAPYRNILLSFQAQYANNYYSQNSYSIQKRKSTTDILTPEQLLISGCVKDFALYIDQRNHWALNADAARLVSTDYEKYSYFISTYKETKPLPYTIADIISITILQQFSNGPFKEENSFLHFMAQNPQLMIQGRDFIELPLQATDTLDIHYQYFKTLQNTIRNQYMRNHPDSSILFEYELMKLNYFHTNCQEITDKIEDSQYFQLLENLQIHYPQYKDRIMNEKAQEMYRYSKLFRYAEPNSYPFRLYAKSALLLMDSILQISNDKILKNNILCIKQIILEKEYTFLNFQENQHSQTDILIPITYKNADSLYVTIYPINKSRYLDHNFHNFNTKKLIGMFAQMRSIQHQQYRLINHNDHQEHSTELAIEGLPLGFYCIVIHGKKKMYDNWNETDKSGDFRYQFIQITDISSIIYQEKDTLQVYVMESNSGVPIQGATITLTSTFRSEEKTLSGVSNEDGYAKIPISQSFPNLYYNSILTDIVYQKDNYIAQSEISWREKSKSIITYCITDRKIYRPGQTVHFKGIRYLDLGGVKKKEVLSGDTLSINLINSNNEIIDTLKVVSNSYGSFNGEFILPLVGHTGEYQIEINQGETRSTFSVEEYKTPQFEILFHNLDNEYVLGDSIWVDCEVKSYSGFKIDQAQIRYNVIQKEWLPWRSTNEREISYGTTNSDESGKFRIGFPAQRFSNSCINQYTISVQATDLNGETHEMEKTLNIDTIPFSISAKIDNFDKNMYSTKSMIIKVLNCDNHPLSKKVKMKIALLTPPSYYQNSTLNTYIDSRLLSEEEFKQRFPQYAWQESELESSHWKESKIMISNELLLPNDSAFTFSTHNWSAGCYRITLSSIDKRGKEISNDYFFDIFDYKSDKMLNYKDLNISLSASSIEVGETLDVSIGSCLREAMVHYIIQCNNKIIANQWIKLQKNQKLIHIPILESYRGELLIDAFCQHDNQLTTSSERCIIPFTNKKLNIITEHINTPLSPGSEEQWQFRITDSKGEPVRSEVLALLYDESNDAMRSNVICFTPYNNYENPYIIHINRNLPFYSYNFQRDRNYPSPINTSHPTILLNPRHLVQMSYGRTLHHAAISAEMDCVMEDKNSFLPAQYSESTAESTTSSIPREKENNDISLAMGIRKNFAETAFFYPLLESDSEGIVKVNFRTPDQLTRWKFVMLAHTPDLESSLLEQHIPSQKPLMIYTNRPRFLREGDKTDFSVKIMNNTDSTCEIRVHIQFYDSQSGKNICILQSDNHSEQTVTCNKKESTIVRWSLDIPKGLTVLSYKITAQSGNYADGEEYSLPILSNRIPVTESMPLYINGKSVKQFTFNKFKNQGSATIENHAYILEFTANPAWYAIQTLPYLISYPYDCNEQIFSKIYANALAAQIVKSNPIIERVFNQWQTDSTQNFQSKLLINEEIKNILLTETPWVEEARSESEQKRELAKYFDQHNIQKELSKQIALLLKAQNENGSWSWFTGLPESQYITQHIVSGFGHLKRLGVSLSISGSVIRKACQYLDREMDKNYHKITNSATWEKNPKYSLSRLEIQYLYARSFTGDYTFAQQKYMQFYLNLAQAQIWEMSLYNQAQIALAFYRYGLKAEAHSIAESILQQAFTSEEMGMYWKSKENSLYSWRANDIERQALFIEMFSEITPNSAEIELMKLWLIKQKQTQCWSNTKATTEAVYAILLQGENPLTDTSRIVINVGKEKFDLSHCTDLEAGTCYFKHRWTGDSILTEMGDITLTQPDKGSGYGAIYWQYFEDMDKISASETGLKITKRIYRIGADSRKSQWEEIQEGETLEVGEKITVRITIEADRNLEFVHLKDMRAAAFEPVNVHTRNMYQEGIWYQESTRDVATNFFIPNLYKGKYIFDYQLFTTQSGIYSNGITSIECMYAPEFSAHSEGRKIIIKNKE